MIAKSEIKLLFIIIIIIKDGGRQYNRHHVTKNTLHRAILFRLLDSVVDSDMKGGNFDLQPSTASKFAPVLKMAFVKAYYFAS